MVNITKNIVLFFIKYSFIFYKKFYFYMYIYIYFLDLFLLLFCFLTRVYLFLVCDFIIFLPFLERFIDLRECVE